ncbi:MAG: cardiolipin synthase [Planctomycetaceae bacterium]
MIEKLFTLSGIEGSSWGNVGFWLTFSGYLISLLLIRWVLLIKKRNPTSTVAWIIVIILVPLLGGLLFLIFGINRVSRRRAEREKSHEPWGHDLARLWRYQLMPGEHLDSTQRRLARLTQRVAGSVPTIGNRIEILDDTNRTLGLIEQAIRGAEHSIHLEYYIWQPDGTGSRVRDLLIEKAQQGVKVRFLYDKIGSMRLGNRFLKPMRDAGIDIAPFLPGASLRERWSINLRSHRKIVIVDGKVGFTGGMNIGDEYLGKNKRLGYWRDTHLRMTGPTVLQLQQVFAEDWYFATGEQILDPQYFPPVEDLGKTVAEVVASEPTGDVDAFYTLMFTAINEARERITLVTSYFVPPLALVTALESAAYRGVKVRIMVAGRSAYFWTVLAGRSYYDSLLTAGVEISEYQRGLLHAKTLTIDGRWSLVGTPNFDARSLLLNFEVAVAMYDSRLALKLEEHFLHDFQYVKVICLEDRRRQSAWQILCENFCRLFAPVL